ncbi:MAG TPA: DUF6259 domain-containing protein [bacterium]|nr:DUF6259 domain-containing protein [bacterium]
MRRACVPHGLFTGMDSRTILFWFVIGIWVWGGSLADAGDSIHLESRYLRVVIDSGTGNWSLLDKQSGVSWPGEGNAAPGKIGRTVPEFHRVKHSNRVARFETDQGFGVTYTLAGGGRALEITFDGEIPGEGIQFLGDALTVQGNENGAVIVPSREGLLIPANSGVAFQREFGTSDYEGCHMNMLGFLKSGAALVLTWDDAYTWPRVESVLPEGPDAFQRLVTTVTLRKTARSVKLVPLGKGDWNTVAERYREIAEKKGLVQTLRAKIRRNRHEELLVGAANVKLWMCLARRMNEESTKEESVEVNWTFDEAAAVAEHIAKEVQIGRCLFTLGGWTEGGYDCRHPDALPANPECGGNEGLQDAVRRIQALGYAACLHDNYQDMYRDAKSWDPAYIEKRADGSLITGGRWMGGRAYMVCAPKQVELALRPQNLPAIQALFKPWVYFIDTTYAVGPRECFDPNHPVGRNEDIAWKIQLSDKARQIFGLFGSECGREWALPHSDFFEGLVGVSGHYYHQLKPAELGAVVIPFWEMVYHDCQICYGKYGFDFRQSAEYVAHHVLTARPLHFHSVPEHKYWLEKPREQKPGGAAASYTRADNGWAAGFHPFDVLLKNTHEILGPLHAATAFQRLERFEFVTPDRSLRRAVYGKGRNRTEVVVNFGSADAAVQTRWGGAVWLPPWGFVVESPRFIAFHAKRWNGIDYPDGALFTLRVEKGRDFEHARGLRIFHGFGGSTFQWKDATWDVPREEVVTVGS